jgi:hypothetical protein
MHSEEWTLAVVDLDTRSWRPQSRRAGRLLSLATEAIARPSNYIALMLGSDDPARWAMRAVLGGRIDAE